MSEKIIEPTIADFIQATYPCIFVRTVEPDRAETAIKAAMREVDMEETLYGVWKVTTGLMVGNIDTKSDVRSQAAQDLRQSLSYIEDSREPVVGVFHNVRKLLDNPVHIQQLMDTVFAARIKGAPVILVGPHIDMPPELRTLITFVDLPLPTKDSIEKEYTKLVSAYEDQLNLPDDKEERIDLIRAAANAAVGLDMMGVENALSLSLATAEKIDIRIIQAQKEQEVRKSDVLEFFPVEDGLDEVGGFDVLKEWLRRRQRVFTEEAREYGLPYPRGMLIVGPAGTGKSLVAKATATYLKLPLLRLDMGKIFRSLVGESEAAIRLALQVVEAVSPVVLWMDEIEKGLAGMKGSGDLDSGVTARVVSTILTWRQETRYPVMMVATANDVASLPSMVYRKGRFDEVWGTDLPTLKEREEIFDIHLKKRSREPDKFNVKLLALKGKDMSGAEIEAVIEDGMFSAFDAGVEVNTKYILRSIGDTVPQATRDREEIQAIREWVDTRGRKVSSREIEDGGAQVRSIKQKTKRTKKTK